MKYFLLAAALLCGLIVAESTPACDALAFSAYCQPQAQELAINDCEVGELVRTLYVVRPADREYRLQQQLMYAWQQALLNQRARQLRHHSQLRQTTTTIERETVRRGPRGRVRAVRRVTRRE